MADDLGSTDDGVTYQEPGDSRVAQYGGASSSQVAALKQKYQPASAAKPKTAPQPAKTETSALDAKGIAATALQSATLGTAATVAGALGFKQMEATIRDTEKHYRADHPLAAFGVDLAVAGATGLIPGLGEANAAKVGAAGLGLVAKRAAVGGAMGGAMGANSVSSGASGGEHVRAGVEGAAIGALGSLGLSALGTLAAPLLNRMGAVGFDASRAAAEQLKLALKKDGKSVSELAEYMRANPDGRLADFSPKVASLVGKEGGRTQGTAKALGDTLRQDASGQAERISAGVASTQPLQRTKESMIDNIEKLQTQRKDTYTLSKTESVAVTPELQRILDHPEVKPMYEHAMKDFKAGREAGISDLQAAPKPRMKDGQVTSIPSAALDDLQKAIGKAAQDEGPGSIRYGTLSAAQRAVKDQQTGNIVNAQQLAARLGGEDSKTGILGAQSWGHSYAFGMKNADIEQFRGMNAEQKEYAKLGMVDGMEKYINDAGRMSEGALTKIADRMRDPQLVEVLGDKNANDIRKVFMKEAARQRVSSEVSKGGNHQAEFHTENEARMASHGVNVAASKAIPGLGTALRLAHEFKIPEKQALAMIDIATKPGGIQRLKDAGVSKQAVDRIADFARARNVASSKVTEQSNLNAQRDDSQR
jgi:hypothetical protein